MTQESTEIIYPETGFGPLFPKQNYMLAFHKEGKQVGTFDFNEGKMHFEGDVSESGEIFVDWVVNVFKQRIEDAIKAEREACAVIAETPISGEQDDITMEAKDRVAKAIRGRGQE